jgi:hypothetical protein
MKAVFRITGSSRAQRRYVLPVERSGMRRNRLGEVR